jgi:hypothetical protein
VAGTALDRAVIDALDENVEIEMLTPRRDGSTSRRPIWVVVVDDHAYVRSYLGPRSVWYRRAVADGRAAIEVAGRTVEVGVAPVAGAELNRRVSEAYRAKYGARSPRPTEAMVSPPVDSTTLRLTA